MSFNFKLWDCLCVLLSKGRKGLVKYLKEKKYSCCFQASKVRFKEWSLICVPEAKKMVDLATKKCASCELKDLNGKTVSTPEEQLLD